MRKKVYVVELTDDERQELHALIHGGTTRARMVNRAQILLHASEEKQDQEIAAALHTSKSTVGRIRKRFVEDGLHGALHEVVRPGGARKLSGGRRRISSLSPVVTHRRAEGSGRCNSWRIAWLPSAWSRRSAMRRCAAR
jgi:hypothetical protein